MSLTPEQMRATAKENSPFIRLADGEKFRGTCVSCEKAKNLQDPTKFTYLYTFNVNGKEKFFKTSSNVFLDKMSNLMGKLVEIERHGEGTETKYEPSIIAE